MGAIKQTGGNILDVRTDLKDEQGRAISVACESERQAIAIRRSLQRLSGVRVLEAQDPAFVLHQGGKLAVCSKVAVNTAEDLALAYTPGVGRVAWAVARAARQSGVARL